MTSENTPPLIYAAMAKTLADIAPVGKDKFFDSPAAKFNFRGIDDVINAVNPALAKNGIFVAPELLEIERLDATTSGGKATRETRVHMCYRFYASDGSNVSVMVSGEAFDTSDKGTAKAFSVAYRIALLQVFAIPTDEPDPDSTYHVREKAPLPEALAGEILTLLDGADGDLERLETAWKVIEEHGYAERPVSGRLETWRQAFTGAYVDEIEKVGTTEAGLALWRLMKRHGVMEWEFSGKPLHALLKARGDQIKAGEKPAPVEGNFERVKAMIAKADNLTEMSNVLTIVNKMTENGQLSETDEAVLRQLFSDRLHAIQEALAENEEPA